METFSFCHPQLLETEGFSKDLECWAVLNEELGPGSQAGLPAPVSSWEELAPSPFSASCTGGCDFQMTI